ncbi:hypothetical protein VKT23_013420 [Stygiomarasmius scandens]|uniref:DUF6534 domain-containing protein n=1 Tax=Marasmiellus scandens TaxID=2682957 RepID=A0ABR1J4M2_9AGAR
MAEAAINIKLILGPVVVSGMINALLFGICVVQFLDYYNAKFKDGPIITGLVVWIAIVDTFSSCTSSYLLWHYAVDGFGNALALVTTPWQYNMIPIFGTLISIPVQFFLAWRIHRFSKSWIIYLVICALSLAQGGLAFASSIGAMLAPSVEANAALIPVADSWLALSVACDLSITLLLSYYLSKSRTGMRATDTVISKLIRTSVETALPVTVFCICDLATLTSIPNSNLHLMFALPMARLYTNTIMTTLNTRTSIRQQMGNTTVQTFGHLVESDSANFAGSRHRQVAAPLNSIQVDVISETRMDDLGGKRKGKDNYNSDSLYVTRKDYPA